MTTDPVQDSEFWIVEITAPADPAYRTVILGPGAHKSPAERWKDVIEQGMEGTQHVPGTVVRVLPEAALPADADAEHYRIIDMGDLPSGTEMLAARIQAETDFDGTGHNFPDLYTLLKAKFGSAKAEELWTDACSYIDYIAEGDEMASEAEALAGEIGDIAEAVTGQLATAAMKMRRIAAINARDIETPFYGDGASDLEDHLYAAQRTLRDVQRILALTGRSS
jgi:hypothetical protein